MRHLEPALLSEVLAFDDDPGWFDPSPEWFVPGSRFSSPEDETGDDELGLRALIEKPEALAKAWCAAGQKRDRRANRPKLRRARRVTSVVSRRQKGDVPTSP